jgi:iron(III) transport system substrate-binding protein
MTFSKTMLRLLSFAMCFMTTAILLNENLHAQQSSDEPLRSLDGLNEKDRERQLIEKAMKETGELTVYSFMRGRDSETILGEFQKKYPFVKNTQHWAGRGTDIWRKISLEAKARKVQADVALGGTLELATARQEGLQLRYESPHRRSYPKLFNDSHGYWLGIAVTATVMAYNEEKLKGMNPPKGFMDVLHDQWSGKLSLDTEPDEFISGMLKGWGPERTEKYFKRLMELKPNLRRGKSIQAELLCAGEFVVSLELYAASVAHYINTKSCPVKIVFPEFIPVKTDALSLIKGSPNPFTAALFFDWLASKVGAQVYVKTGRISPRTDIEAPYPEVRGILQKTEVIDILPASVDEKFTKEVHDFMRQHLHRRR